MFLWMVYCFSVSCRDGNVSPLYVFFKRNFVMKFREVYEQPNCIFFFIGSITWYVDA